MLLNDTQFLFSFSHLSWEVFEVLFSKDWLEVTNYRIYSMGIFFLKILDFSHIMGIVLGGMAYKMSIMKIIFSTAEYVSCIKVTGMLLKYYFQIVCKTVKTSAWQHNEI